MDLFALFSKHQNGVTVPGLNVSTGTFLGNIYFLVGDEGLEPPTFPV